VFRESAAKHQLYASKRDGTQLMLLLDDLDVAPAEMRRAIN